MIPSFVATSNGFSPEEISFTSAPSSISLRTAATSPLATAECRGLTVLGRGLTVLATKILACGEIYCPSILGADAGADAGAVAGTAGVELLPPKNPQRPPLCLRWVRLLRRTRRRVAIVFSNRHNEKKQSRARKEESGTRRKAGIQRCTHGARDLYFAGV